MRHDSSNGIHCPKCGSTKSFVVDSRGAFEMIRRRRVCVSCEHRYTTYEIVLNVRKPSELANKLKGHHFEILKNLDGMLDLITEVGKLPEMRGTSETV